MSPTEWIDPDPPMTDTPQYVGQSFPLERGEVLGRFLDPVREAALKAAYECYRYFEPDEEGDSIGEILAVAARFEAYLDPSEEEQPQP